MNYVESAGYVGYGPNSDPDLVEAITGESPLLVTEVAQIQNVRLYVQGLDQIPDSPLSEGEPSVRNILRDNYGDAFEAYGLRPYEGDTVRARYFELKPTPLARMRAWDFADAGWFSWCIASVVVLSPTHTEDGRTLHRAIGLTTYIPDNQRTKRRANGQFYPDFLVDKEKMIEVATRVRLEGESQA